MAQIKWFLAISVVLSVQVIFTVTGCKKNVSNNYSFLQKSAAEDPFLSTSYFGKVILSPSINDTGVQLNNGVIIRINKLADATRLHITGFQVKKGSEPVPGQVTYTDTSATFLPDVDFDKLTKYTVSMNGLVDITPERELQPSVAEVNVKWSFTTSATEPEYIMTLKTDAMTGFARDGSKMMQMGNYLYLFGGWTADALSETSWNDVYRSSGDLATWKKMPDAPWSGRHTFGIGKLREQLFIFGGDHNNPVFDVWKSYDGENFERIVTDLDASVRTRFIYGTCVHNNKLFVMGGQSSITETDSGLYDVWSSPNGLAWKKVADHKTFLGKNLAGAVASFNGKIWVVGGGYYRHPDTALRWTNHVYSSPDGINWTQENDAPWVGRQYADLCVWDNKLWMVGGHNGENLSDIWYMNKLGTWTQFIPPNLFSPRHATAVAVYDDKLVLGCGNMHNECWVIEKNR